MDSVWDSLFQVHGENSTSRETNLLSQRVTVLQVNVSIHFQSRMVEWSDVAEWKIDN
jgi:hypothetical protein